MPGVRTNQAERRFATFDLFCKVGTALSADWMRPSRSPRSIGRSRSDYKAGGPIETAKIGAAGTADLHGCYGLSRISALIRSIRENPRFRIQERAISDCRNMVGGLAIARQLAAGPLRCLRDLSSAPKPTASPTRRPIYLHRRPAQAEMRPYPFAPIGRRSPRASSDTPRLRRQCRRHDREAGGLFEGRR